MSPLLAMHLPLICCGYDTYVTFVISFSILFIVSIISSLFLSFFSSYKKKLRFRSCLPVFVFFSLVDGVLLATKTSCSVYFPIGFF